PDEFGVEAAPGQAFFTPLAFLAGAFFAGAAFLGAAFFGVDAFLAAPLFAVEPAFLAGAFLALPAAFLAAARPGMNDDTRPSMRARSTLVTTPNCLSCAATSLRTSAR